MATTTFDTSISTVAPTVTTPTDALWADDEYSSNLCGYISGALASPLGCNSGSACRTNSDPNYVACCADAEESREHCKITTSCIDGPSDPSGTTRFPVILNALTCTSEGFNKCCHYEFSLVGDRGYSASPHYISWFCGAPTSAKVTSVNVPWTPVFFQGFENVDYHFATGSNLLIDAPSVNSEGTSSSSSYLYPKVGASGSYMDPEESRNLAQGLGIAIPLTLIALALGIWAFIIYKRRRRATATGQPDSEQVQPMQQRPSLDHESMNQLDPPPPYLASPDFTHIESH